MRLDSAGCQDRQPEAAGGDDQVFVVGDEGAEISTERQRRGEVNGVDAPQRQRVEGRGGVQNPGGERQEVYRGHDLMGTKLDHWITAGAARRSDNLDRGDGAGHTGGPFGEQLDKRAT